MRRSEYGALKESKPVGASVPDVTDVLLQLKHAQLSPSSSFSPYSAPYSTPYSSSYSASYAPPPPPAYSGPSASLSYTVHPQVGSPLSSSASPDWSVFEPTARPPTRRRTDALIPGGR